MSAGVDGFDLPVLRGHAKDADHRAHRKGKPVVQLDLIVVYFQDTYIVILDVLPGDARFRTDGEHAGIRRFDLLHLNGKHVADMGFFYAYGTGYGNTVGLVDVTMGIGFFRKETPETVLCFHDDGLTAVHSNGG